MKPEHLYYKKVNAKDGAYYARKVKIGNLKQMAGTLAFLQDNGIGSVDELSRLLSSTYSDFNEKQKALRSTVKWRYRPQGMDFIASS